MRSFFRKVPWIAVAFLVLLSCVSPALAFGPATGSATGTASLIASLHPTVFLPEKSSCTREGMDHCEYSCMMPGGILDLNCYEDCIYLIC
ncbi:hypothetical protein [Methanoregula sp.]|uniref:hypothetical protein n=1 Tax=Methanoregula sp. TaxID=2052170 RepID=UPI002C521E1F|nr:hypothetical protein [Methanoregula sp.]HVP96742.1 hypothetical protein [Methanoregula sp.]